MKCQICKRALTAQGSIALGVGPECADKRAKFLASCATTVEEIACLIESGIGEAQKWGRSFLLAMGAGRRRDAECFLAAARKAVGV